MESFAAYVLIKLCIKDFKMLKKKNFPVFMILIVFVLFGCATNSVRQEKPKEPEITEPKIETQKPSEETKKTEIEDPANVKFAKQLQKFLDAGNIEGAVNHFQNLPQELSDDLELKFILGALYYSNQQYDEAIAVAQEILKVDPQNIDALELSTLSKHAKGDTKSYKEEAEKILAVDPYNTTVNIQKAEEYVLNKKYKLAKDSYKKALKGNSENEDAMFGYAQMCFYTDDLKSAKFWLEKILAKNPKNATALSYMGKIAYDEENYLRAAKYFKEAIENDSSNYNYWLDYGKALRYQGKFEEAEKAWIRATQLDPTYFLAYAYLAGTFDDLGNYEKALENYHKVIETNPKYYFAYESAAVLEYHAKNYEEAIKMFSKAYDYNAQWAYALMIAACYFKMGNTNGAKNALTIQLKKMERSTVEYELVRFFLDTYSKNAETTLKQKIDKETDSNKRGKMLFYMGLYCEIKNASELAKEYYAKVTNMQAPMFFEYRLAEWGIQE